MILTNILQGGKYGVVQKDSPISRDFLFLAIKLNGSDRIFPKKEYVKGTVSISKCANLKQIHLRKRERITFSFAFFGYADAINYQEKPTILCERAQITTARIISACAVIKL